MGDLRKEIARLRSLTPELNAVTDRATKIVLAVEHFLNDECQLGLPAFVCHQDGDAENGVVCYGTRLEYSRWEGKFRLVVSNYKDVEGFDQEISDRNAWVNCTRDRKLETVIYIPALLKEIERRVLTTIAEANKHSGIVESYLAELGIAREDQ
jgi:hypothetical protein